MGEAKRRRLAGLMIAGGAFDTAFDEAFMEGERQVLHHEVTRRSDLASNGLNPKADEAYFQSAVKAWHQASASKFAQGSRIYLCVGGYIDDPRELWQIPEVCRFMKRWADEVKALEDPRLLPGARKLLEAFGCTRDGTPKQ